MNQPSPEIESIFPAANLPQSPSFVNKVALVEAQSKSEQPLLLTTTDFQRMIAERRQMEERVFHNVDISQKSKGFGRAYAGQIKDAIKDLGKLDSQMLATEDGQKIVISAAEQLFSERSFSVSDLARVQAILKETTNGGMLSTETISELKKITLDTLKARLKKPAELALKYNGDVISVDQIRVMMSASFDWTAEGGRSMSSIGGTGITPEVKAARARADALRQQQSLDDVSNFLGGIDIGSLSGEQSDTVKSHATALITLLEQHGAQVRRNKEKENQENLEEGSDVKAVAQEIEQIMAQLQADGVVTDASIITKFTQSGSLSAYQSIQGLIDVIKNFRATLLGKKTSEIELGSLGIYSLSSCISVDEDR